MKVLITGKNGYIATNLKTELEQNGFEVVTASFREGAKSINLDNVDMVVHCAAIVHKRERDFADMYDRVNHIEAVELAKTAKNKGVKHFVFMSTMSVYGKKSGEINADTPMNPTTLYGKSKLSAEREINMLADTGFVVTIVRPPMVYGKNCPGNFASLKRLALKTPVFPKVNNKRSMIYVGNLTRCIRNILENSVGGEVMPMDSDYVNTSEMVKEIALCAGKRVYLSRLLGLMAGIPKKGVFLKVFGSLYYGESVAAKCDYFDFKMGMKDTSSTTFAFCKQKERIPSGFESYK